jgi:hypothetical protein
MWHLARKIILQNYVLAGTPTGRFNPIFSDMGGTYLRQQLFEVDYRNPHYPLQKVPQ